MHPGLEVKGLKILKIETNLGVYRVYCFIIKEYNNINHGLLHYLET